MFVVSNLALMNIPCPTLPTPTNVRITVSAISILPISLLPLPIPLLFLLYHYCKLSERSPCFFLQACFCLPVGFGLGGGVLKLIICVTMIYKKITIHAKFKHFYMDSKSYKHIYMFWPYKGIFPRAYYYNLLSTQW